MEEKKQTNYQKRKASSDRYRSKIRRFTLQFSLHDKESREWFERQTEPGDYLKGLILEDKYRQMETERRTPGYEDMSREEKRMAGAYEIIQTMQIGDREVVLGENPQNESGMKYMCAYCQQNALFAQYSEVLGSDDFAEIAALFGRRVEEQAEKTRLELEKSKAEGIGDMPITAEGCNLISHEADLNGKIVVIKPEVLRREYRRATHQLKLCTGGSGASPHSRGTACYCIDLYSGKESRYERMDVLGTIEPEKLPGWGRQRLADIQNRQQQKTKKKERGR